MNMMFKSVNWMQGMSVSSSHFIATENYLMERMMRNTAALQNKFEYGLLPMDESEKDSQMQLSVEGKGDGTRIVLSSYRGITKGGCLVCISPSQPVVCECGSVLDSSEYGWDVVLSVSPFDRRPCGEPDMMENPPRYPFVEPEYKLSVIERDKSHVNEYGPYDVVVGLLWKIDGTLKLDSEYIAPSLSISSCTQLRRYFDMFTQSIQTMKSALSVIFCKAYSSNANKTTVLEDTLTFCKEIQRSMANMEFGWRSYGLRMTPYQVAEMFGGMANSALLSFSFMPKSNKDEMLKYFYEWNGITPSAFEEILSDVATKDFCQNRIDTSMTSIYKMTKMLEDLLIGLSKLDYVGQRKESMVISVTSANEGVGQSKKSSWLL